MGKAWGRMTALLLAGLLLLVGCRGGGTAKPAPAGTGGATAAATAATAVAGSPTLYFLNVGKGDAALIGLPDGQWVMVDTGVRSGVGEVGRTLRRLGITRLSAIFLSHPHGDHRGGLATILAMASCDAFYTTDYDFQNNSVELDEVLADNNLPKQTMAAGDVVTIGQGTFTAVGPNGTFEEENDNSLVLRMDCAGLSVLFVGDQGLDAEAALLQSGQDIDCDVLKVGHHGKDDASGEDFLQAVSPAIAIIPNEDSDDNGVALVVAHRLQALGSTTAVLGHTGTVRVWMGENGLEMEPVAAPGEPAALAITALDPEAESVTVTNQSDTAVDLTGWSLLSEKGNDFFFFPAGMMLAPGESATIWSGVESVPAGGLHWSTRKMWRDRKSNLATLTDPYGRVVSTLG